MGQTDSQFKAFIRFIVSALNEVRKEKDEEKRNKKLDEILANLNETLKD